VLFRSVYAGSGGLVRDARGVRFLLSPRGEHVREGIGRPAWDRTAIADLKAPPLAGGRRCRRVHVVAGEGNYSEPATFLKVGATALVLRLLEERPDAVPDLTLDHPVAAIQAVSADSTGRARLRLATGRDTSALGLQATFLDGVHHLVATEGSSTEEDRVLRLWEACLTGLESEATALSSTLDWVARRSSLEAVADSLLDPRAADVDRAWDVVYPEVPTDAVPHHPAMDRICSHAEVSAAGPPTNLPPETTRARLRSQFVRACRANDRQYAVDWTHLIVRDQLQTSVALDDPLVSSDSRVDRLLALLEQSPEAASESS
jgi:proteasome accessory factor A